jgi:hypothetical protein
MVRAKPKAGKPLRGESGGTDVNEKRTDYLSYLLRLWRENDSEGAHGIETAVWRASLERPQAGERRGFANLADLFAFLESETMSNSLGSEPRKKMNKP